MIPNHPVGEVFAWVLFSLVLVWALWQGLPEFAQWLGSNSDGREDMQFFPDEVRGEPGPRMSVASQGEIDPRDGAASTRSQAR
jgi:hypothetical protein